MFAEGGGRGEGCPKIAWRVHIFLCESPFWTSVMLVVLYLLLLPRRRSSSVTLSAVRHDRRPYSRHESRNEGHLPILNSKVSSQTARPPLDHRNCHLHHRGNYLRTRRNHLTTTACDGLQIRSLKLIWVRQEASQKPILVPIGT